MKNNNRCKYISAEKGLCGKLIIKNKTFCDEHLKEKCCECGQQATHECTNVTFLICGFPLCDTCTHSNCK